MNNREKETTITHNQKVKRQPQKFRETSKIAPTERSG